MADPLGKLLTGFMGYALCSRQERRREANARLNDERIVRTQNRVYAKAYAFLSRVRIGNGSARIPLVDLVGEPALMKFALDLSELVHKELEQQS